MHANARGTEARRSTLRVVEQEEAEQEDEVVEEGVIRREDDPDLERGDDREAHEPRPGPEPRKPDDAELDDEREHHREGVEPMRKVLRVPADPRRERAVLVVVIHRREAGPLRVTAQNLDDARLEVDPKPLPPQQKERRTRRRGGLAEPRTEPSRREEERQERRLEEHAVGLVHRELLADRDEGEESDPRDRDRPAGPDIDDEEERRREPEDDERRERAVARAEPEKRRREPQALDGPRLGLELAKVVVRGKDSARADQSVNLVGERNERGEEDPAERAKEEPARPETRGPPHEETLERRRLRELEGRRRIHRGHARW